MAGVTVLNNKGFERRNGFATDAVDVYRADGTPVDTIQRGEDNPPAGWREWYVWDYDELGYAQPESKYNTHAERVKAGESGWMMFSFYRRHRGGLLQTVDAEPGTRYHFTIANHAWSSTDDEARSSDGAGFGPFYSKLADLDVGLDHGLRNYRARVGIDSTGGTDPFADTVVWGEWAVVYNTYHDLPPAEATAQGDKLTVFTEHYFLWPFKHCDVYYESAILSPVAQPVIWAPPRVDYERTYVLLHPGAGLEYAVAAMEATWEAKRWTVGGSADDAGIGPTVRRVIATNPEQWSGDLHAFFAAHYPGIQYVPLQAAEAHVLKSALQEMVSDEPAPAPRVPWDVDLHLEIPRRYDLAAWPQGRWPARELSEITHVTVHHIGSKADVLKHSEWYLTKEAGRPAPPYTVWIERDGTAKLLLDLTEANWHDHSGHTRNHLSIGLNGALHLYPPTPEQLEKLVEICVWVIQNPSMNVTRETITGHMDWASTECPGWLVKVDGASRNHWKDEFMRMLDAGLGNPSPPVTPAPIPPPSGGSTIPRFENVPRNLAGGAHFGMLFKYWQDLVQNAPPGVMKGFAAGEVYEVGRYIREVVEPGVARPKTRTFWRKFVENDGGWVNVADRRASARAFLELYKQETATTARNLGISEAQVLSCIDYIQGLNEVIGTFDPETPRHVEFELYLSEEVEAWAGDLLRLTYPAVAVGNPHETEVVLLEPLARRSMERGDVIDYHAYHTATWRQHFVDEHWPYHAGRWTEWDKQFVSKGVYPLYMFGEMGVVASNNGDGTNFGGGQSWKAIGDFPYYLQGIKKVNDRVLAWNAENGDRCIGGGLFTMKIWGWDEFLVGDGDVILLWKAAQHW